MNSLEQYARANGEGEPVKAPSTPVSYRERKETLEAVAKMKTAILQQLEQGKDLESILFDAVTALGMATNDDDFAERAALFIDYDGPEMSFFVDLDDMEARRLERRKKYYAKRGRDINRQLKQLEEDKKVLWQELEQVQRAIPFSERVEDIL